MKLVRMCLGLAVLISLPATAFADALLDAQMDVSDSGLNDYSIGYRMGMLNTAEESSTLGTGWWAHLESTMLLGRESTTITPEQKPFFVKARPVAPARR